MAEKIAQNEKYHFWIFFIVLLFLSALMIYFYQPLCPGQDFFFHFRRLQASMDGLSNPCLIYLDYNALEGYGYFTKAFYPDVILIPFAWIGNLTSADFAYQLMLFTMTALCGVFTYITVNKIYKNTFAASAGALLYTFCVYRLLDVYQRAALGESLSFTFLPLVFLGLYHIIKGDYRKWYILAIGYSLLIFTHLISSVLMFVTMLILLIVYYKPLIKEPKRIKYLLIAGVVTLITVSYYILPMLEQMLSNEFYYESRNIFAKAKDSALDYHWIIWGMFTGVIPPAQIFVPGVGLLLTCGIALRIFVYGKSEELRSIDTGVIIGLAYIVVASPLMLWSVFPFSLLNFIQMGWRFFEFSSFFFAIAGGYYLSKILKTNKRMVAGGILIIAATIIIVANDAKIYKAYRCERPVTQEAAFGNDYHLGGLEYIPEKVPSIEYIHQQKDSVSLKYAESHLSHFKKAGGITSFDIEAHNGEAAELPLIYYKGYKAILDGQDIPISESENGLVQVQIDKPGHVEVHYAGTTIQYISFYLTIISILGLLVYISVNSYQLTVNNAKRKNRNSKK